MTVSLIAGLLSLLGVFAGAALSRRTEYEKWHRQARMEAFAALISNLHDARLNATAAYYSPDVPDSDRNMKVTEIYVAARKHVDIARLFIRQELRDDLSSIYQDIWLESIDDGGPAKHVQSINKLMERVRSLIESELKSGPST